jgi:L-aminopeptidase/D-esterase-like protein
MRPTRPSHFTGVRGVRAGHSTDEKNGTGVTVVAFPGGAYGAVEMRGGAPGTYHTDGLGPMGAIGRLEALFFSGGSLYGLDAAQGVRRGILESGGGINLWGSHSKLVGISGAVIFDLPHDHPLRADYEELGYQAARASTSRRLASGSLGAGRGATVGKLNGKKHSMKGGVGSSAVTLPGGEHVGALAVVNAVGSVVDPSTGNIAAGARSRKGNGFAPREELLERWIARKPLASDRGTVLVLVTTDLAATRWDLARMSRAANDAVARAVIPAHMASDGDIAFAVCTNSRPDPWPHGEESPYPGARADLLGFLVEEIVVAALLDAVKTANPPVAQRPSHGRTKTGRG